MADDKIELEIVLDDGTLKKGFVAVEQIAKATGQKITDEVQTGTEKGFSNLLGGIKGKLIAVGAAVAGAFAFKNIIENAMEAENALNDFSAALRASGNFSQTAVSDFEEYAKSLQKITTVGDDLIIQNAAILASLGGLSGQGLKDATKAALDLAAGMNIDVGSAFDLVAKAASGSVGALGRYGIKVKEAGTDSEKFAIALGMIQDKFGGLAEAKIDTFGGAISQMQNLFGDLLETIGMFIIKSPQFVATIKFVGKQINEAIKFVEDLGKQKNVINEFFQSFASNAEAITRVLITPLEIAANLGNFVFNALKTRLQTFIAAFASGFSLMVDGLAKLGLVSDETKQSFQEFADSTKDVLSDFSNQTADAFTRILDTPVTDKLSEIAVSYSNTIGSIIADNELAKESFNSVQEVIDTSVGVAQGFETIFSGMSSAATDFANKATENFKKVGQQMFMSLGTMGANAFAAFGKALVTGKNAMQSFIDSLVSAMGQMAVMLGSQFILQGIAYMWAGLPNGPSLIAAGAALAAFGGILSAVGGGGGGAPASGGGGGVAAGGGVGTPGMDQGPTQFNEQLQKERAQTVVNVNVEGNILDKREEGLRIADVLNEFFDTSGGAIARTV